MDRDGQQEFHQHMLNLQEQEEREKWFSDVEQETRRLPDMLPPETKRSELK